MVERSYSQNISNQMDYLIMDIATIILIGVPIIVWLWIATIAIISVKNDSSLEVFQRTSQIIIVLILPLLGAAIVLHLVNQHSPEVIPKSNIPWPFKFILFGKETPKNKIGIVMKNLELI